MANNNALGGLYVSVGLDAAPALRAAQKLQLELLNVAAAINNLNKKSDLSRVTKQLDGVARAAERAAKASADASGKAAAAGQKASASAAAAAGRQARQQAQMDEELLKLKLRAQADYFNRVRVLQSSGKLNEAQAVKIAADKEIAIRLVAALRQGQISETLFNKKMGYIQAYLKQVESATRREIAANQQAAASAQQKMTVLQAVFGRSQSLLIGAGAFRSGNFFYGTAAVGGYFKSLFDGLKAVKGGAQQATQAVDALGAAAGPKGMAVAQLTKVAGGLGAAAVALAAIVPIVGIALTAVGAKIAQFGLEASMELEMLKIQYEGLLGSAEAAKREVDFVMALGTQSIVPTEQLLDANRLLLAFGVQNDAARQSLLSYISAFSSVTGASLTQVQNLSYALGQINAAGKANAIDLRQLANAGVSTASIFENIAEQQGISVEEARKLSDEGKLYANIILPAILAGADKLAAAEDKARESARGILVNLKDIAKINAGKAFEGLLQSLKPILKWVETFIKAFDFRVIAQAWGQVVGYFKQAFKGMGADAATTSRGVSTTIAKAINIVGFVAVRIAQLVVAVFDTIMVAVNFVWAGIQQAVSGLLYAVSAIMEVAATIPNPWQDAARSVADSSWTMAEEAAKGAEIASNAWVNGASAAANAWIQFATVIPEFKGIDELPPLPEVELPEIGTPVFNNPLEDLDKATGKANKAVNEYLDRILALLEKARDAGKKLAEALTLPFAEAIKAGGAVVKTAAEEAFSSMDINTIVQQFSELKQNITDFYAPMVNVEAAGSRALAGRARRERNELIRGLRAQTYELVRLASENKRLAQELEEAEKAFDKAMEGFSKSREKLTASYKARQKEIAKTYDDYYTATSMTEGTFTKGALTKANEALEAASKAYEAAKEKLDALREARDSFLKSIADSVKSFVNNISNVAKEIQVYTRLDDIGSFSMTTSKQADLESFRRSLRERLDILRQWREQVKQLMARGLDSDFLQTLVQAGPEASREAVAALAGASDAELADINNIQSQLSSEILALQESASAQWFDAGIKAQEAFTAPLKAAYEAAQKNVNDLTAAKDLALGVLEAWYAEQNEMIDEQEKAAKDAFDKTREELEGKMGENQKKANEIATAINGIWDKLPGKAYTGGVNTMISLIEGLKSKEGALKAEANRIANILENTIRRALNTNSPSKVMESIGEDTVDGLILGMTKSGVLADTTIDFSAFTSAVSVLPDVEPAETVVNQEIRVFLGDQELTHLVDVQIQQSNNVNTDLVIAGRRY